MTRNDVNNLVKIIQVHRPYFVTRLGDEIYKELVNEWTRLMEPYDYEDVKANLEKFLMNENNYGREPDAYQLIRGLLTTKDKEENSKGQVCCMFCNRIMTRLEIHGHEDRCRSIKYLKRLYKKYFRRELEDIAELYNMSGEDFDKAYIFVLEKALPYMTDLTEKRGVTNVIETYYGREPKYKVSDL